ncbi:MAG: VCBS repeat-containing protein [Clostridiales bacterium]|nr:VCBS repeat-containing protein [Clostridiales bacterium]
MKRGLILALGLVFLCFFAGCSLSDTDELYSLPQPPYEFLQLQGLIDDEIAAGWEYSAPTIGSFRQSVQLTDLNGDGVNEALAFLYSKEMGPKICVYRKGLSGYELAATIAGEGTAIGRVEYADLDGDGMVEILTTWKMSADMRIFKAYSIENWTSSLVFTTSCTDFQVGDLDKDGTPDVAVLRLDQNSGSVDVFNVSAKGEVVKTEARLSASLSSVDRFRIATIGDGSPAIFVEGRYLEGDELYNLTDIIVSDEGKLKNICLDVSTGDSRAKRHYPVYCTDINGDGSLAVPFAEKLYSQPGYLSDNYVFDWFRYDALGNSEACGCTYHNYTDGWYFMLPDEWRDDLTVRRESGISGERSVVLSHFDEETQELTDYLTIYVLSGENRRDRAKIAGRFTMLNSETVIYAAKLHTIDDVLPSEEAQKDITDRFHLIYTEWITGAV